MTEKSTTPDLEERALRWEELTKSRDYDGMMRMWARNGVWDQSRLGLGTYEGQAAIRGFFEDWIGAYDEFQLEVQEARDLGNGVQFGVIVQTGRPTGSTGSVQIRYGSVSILVDGLIERVTNYGNIDQARAAAERLAQERG